MWCCDMRDAIGNACCSATRLTFFENTRGLSCSCGARFGLYLWSLINMNHTVAVQTLYLFRPVWEQVGPALLETRMYYSNVTHTVGRWGEEGPCWRSRAWWWWCPSVGCQHSHHLLAVFPSTLHLSLLQSLPAGQARVQTPGELQTAPPLCWGWWQCFIKRVLGVLVNGMDSKDISGCFLCMEYIMCNQEQISKEFYVMYLYCTWP